MIGTRKLVLAVVLISFTASAAWECIGPEGGPITILARSVVDDQTLYAVTGSYPFKLLRSQDEGQSWENVGSCNGYPYGMDVGADDVIYVGGSGATYVSTDGGETWDTNYHSYHYFWRVAAHPTDPDVAHAAGYVYDNGNYNMAAMTTTDGGVSWTTHELETDARGRCVGISPADPDRIMVGGYITGSYTPSLYLSTDGGSSWSDVTPSGSSDDYYMQSVGFHPTDPDVALAATYYGVYRTTNCGASWTETQSQYYNYTMDYSPADADVVFCGGYYGVYRSTDGGLSWSQYSSGLTGSCFDAAEVSPVDESLAYLGNDDGFFRSTDTGITWEASNSGIIVGEVLAYCWYGGSSTLYKSMVDLGIYKTENYGSGWEQMTMPLACGDVCGIAVSPTDPDQILVLEGDG
jgi:photosystem II stability/assembly factor-like uncharacterized protein